MSDEERMMQDKSLKWSSASIINNDKKQKSCAELVLPRYKEREDQFSKAFKKYFWPQYMADNTLDFSFIEPNTFKDQKDGYWRLQFSWGGPSDEIRYYKDKDVKPDDKYQYQYEKITYCYMDWFDGAEIQVHADIWHKIFDQQFEIDATFEGPSK